MWPGLLGWLNFPSLRNLYHAKEFTYSHDYTWFDDLFLATSRMQMQQQQATTAVAEASNSQAEFDSLSMEGV